jgi:hypothetical protein
MDIMGWSNSAMVKRYAHVTARLRRDIADRLNSLSLATSMGPAWAGFCQGHGTTGIASHGTTGASCAGVLGAGC